MAIYIILAYYTTYIFLILTSDIFLLTTTLFNRIVLSIANASTLAVFYTFLIYANRSLTLLLSSML